MKKATKEYSWAEGSRIKLDPQAAGPVLERLISKHGDGMSARVVVEAARAPSSPLHDHFEWDDERAAHQHRLEAARLLLRSFRCFVRVTPNGDPTPMRVVVGIRSQSEEERYVPVSKLVEDRELFDKFATQLVGELRAFATRNAEFRGHERLRGVFREIDKL